MDFIDLEDVYLIPSPINDGFKNARNFSTVVYDNVEYTLPLITAPTSSIIGLKSCQTFQSNGIKVILPRSLDLQSRLYYCSHVFTAFSLEEVEREFLSNNRNSGNVLYKICIDAGNGQDKEVLKCGEALKNAYGQSIMLMGGNITNPSICAGYNAAGFSFIRVGPGGGISSKFKYGFEYPIVNLLMDINKDRSKFPYLKVIADCDVESPSEILKLIALGADYVMVGRSLAKVVEAEGDILRKFKDKGGKTVVEKLNCNPIDLNDDYKSSVFRKYTYDPTPEIQEIHSFGFTDEGPLVENIGVDTTLSDWIKDVNEAFFYGFMITGSTNWIEFRKKAGYGKY